MTVVTVNQIIELLTYILLEQYLLQLMKIETSRVGTRMLVHSTTNNAKLCLTPVILRYLLLGKVFLRR